MALTWTHDRHALDATQLDIRRIIGGGKVSTVRNVNLAVPGWSNDWGGGRLSVDNIRRKPLNRIARRALSGGLCLSLEGAGLGSGLLGTLLATAALGVLLGLRYRVPAVLLASFAVAIAGAVVAAFSGASVLAALALSWGGVAALQCGYVVGLLIGYALWRVRRWRRGEQVL